MLTAQKKKEKEMTKFQDLQMVPQHMMKHWFLYLLKACVVEPSVNLEM
jgi:hypothetical protein